MVKIVTSSSEPMATSNYMRYLELQHYEHGMQYDAHEYVLIGLCIYRIQAMFKQLMGCYISFWIQGENTQKKNRGTGGCQKLNTSTKSVYVTQLSDALII